jgi:hypothetical protein
MAGIANFDGVPTATSMDRSARRWNLDYVVFESRPAPRPSYRVDDLPQITKFIRAEN